MEDRDKIFVPPHWIEGDKTFEELRKANLLENFVGESALNTAKNMSPEAKEAIFKELAQLNYLQTSSETFDGPEYPDGLDSEGFPGGDERFNIQADSEKAEPKITSQDKATQVAQNLLVQQAKIQKDKLLEMIAEGPDKYRLAKLKSPELAYGPDDTTLMVEEFHQKFDLHECLDNMPHVPNAKLALLRIQCLTEEVAELAHAFGKEDLVGILDALTDIQYFLDGTYLLCGLESVKLQAMAEVHRSNLTKLGLDGKAIKDASGRVSKPAHYQRPDLGKVLDDYKKNRLMSCYGTGGLTDREKRKLVKRKK